MTGICCSALFYKIIVRNSKYNIDSNKTITVSNQLSMQVKKDSVSKAFDFYHGFLAGKINATDEYNDVTLKDVYRFDNTNFLPTNEYAFYDMNGDGIPELLTRAVSDSVYIFTVRNKKLVVWHDMIPYCKVFNDGSTLLTIHNGGPTHLIYVYNIYDFNGNERQSISFEKYDRNEDGKYNNKDLFLFDSKEVSKETWDDLTKKYLEIKSDKIEWKPFENLK